MKMRAFIVFLALVACAVAAPQGYNYNAPVPAGPPASAPHSGGPAPPSQGPVADAPPPSAPAAPSGPAGPAVPSQSYLNPAPGPGPAYLAPASKPEIVVSKHFYVHAGPDYHDSQTRNIDLGPAKKHYKVIFIKPPTFTNSATLSINPPQTEEKTFIYVLSQKTDLGDIQTEVRPSGTQPSKPEVFFIKYRTPEEAAHAQREIQAQYDALGGITQINDEGLAPVQNYIGALGQTDGYLPPSY